MLFGTHSIADLQAIAELQRPVAELSSEQQLNLWEFIRIQLDAHNRMVDEQRAEFFEVSSERIAGAGGSDDGEMQEIAEFGSPDVQKPSEGALMGFPLRRYAFATQWTRKYMEIALPADLVATTNMVMNADVRNMQRQIRRAIYTPTNTSFVDRLMRSAATLPVKALANADGFPIPVNSSGVSFNAGTHTHYLGTSSFAAANLSALIATVREHYSSGEVRVVINQAQAATVRAFTGFVPVTNARIVQPTSATYVASPGRDVSDSGYNQLIGIFDDAEIWIKPWAVANYVVAYHRGGRPLLRYRQRSAAYGSLRLVYEDENHPLRAETFEREFGIAPQERTGAAVLLTNNATYSAPTL